MAGPGTAIVGVADEGSRLDVFLAGCPGVVSRNQAQQLIEAGKVRVDGRLRGKKYQLKLGESVSFEPPVANPPTVEAEQIPVKIIFEDEALAVVDKPAGMVVHPAAGTYGGTLVNALLAHTSLANIGAPLRPGIVHRLDKDTSGLIVVAKTDLAYMSLVGQIKERGMTRRYFALVEGSFADEGGLIDAPIGRSPRDRKKMAVNVAAGKPAITEFTVLESLPGYSLLDVSLKTGRTHQIRVHMKYINHPVAGDPVYGSGGALGLKRQFLHSHRLEFDHPLSRQRLVFTSDLPSDLETVWRDLKGGEREDKSRHGRRQNQNMDPA